MSETPRYSYFLIAFMALLLIGYGLFELVLKDRRRTEDGEKLQPRNVYIITAGGLRPDHLSCDQYQPIQTPQMDFLAQDGIRFKHAFTTSPSPVLAHVSLLTGYYPFRNPQDQTGLAATLRKRGYQTAAFVANPDLKAADFLKWFEESHTVESTREVRTTAGRWIVQHRNKPQFALINFNEPSYPFQPPAPYNLQYANYPYDGETSALDAEIGLLINGIKNDGLYRNAIIVFTAPYASRLDGTGNGAINVEELHVPLFITAPGLLPEYQTYANQVSLVDIFPTLLPLLNLVKTSESFDGVALFKKGIRDEVYRDLLFGATIRPDGSLEYFAHSQAGDLYTGEEAEEREKTKN